MCRFYSIQDYRCSIQMQVIELSSCTEHYYVIAFGNQIFAGAYELGGYGGWSPHSKQPGVEDFVESVGRGEGRYQGCIAQQRRGRQIFPLRVQPPPPKLNPANTQDLMAIYHYRHMFQSHSLHSSQTKSTVLTSAIKRLVTMVSIIINCHFIL